MVKYEKSVVIDRPADEVFDYVADGEQLSHWSTEVMESKKTSDGPVGVGTTYTHIVQVLGRRIENHYNITEYEANRKISMKSTSGPVPAEFSLIVAPVDGSTKLTLRVEAEGAGFFKLAEPLVGRTLERQHETNLANLKDLLEHQS